MKKNLLIYFIFIGLLGIFGACEKDEDKVVMKETPTAPDLKTIPDLALKRADGLKVLLFEGTSVDPGFVASASYFLEACAKGNNFEDKFTIYNGIKADSIKVTVSDLNNMLLKKFDGDITFEIDLRLRAVLVTDAGTGVKPMEYISEVKTVSVTTYGLPRLDVIVAGEVVGKIESALGDGKYRGFVKLDKTKPFTLKDPDANKVYGATGTALVVDGAGISIANTGWHDFKADVNALTYEGIEHFIGLVGSATPNGWDSPDQKMDYNAKTGQWYITIDLVPGAIKFRRNDGWSWNMGFVEGATPGMEGETQQGGVGNDIPITAAGNYTVYFSFESDSKGYYKIVKN